MTPLQYRSEEMFSSTELIRKSKKVFDKLQKKEIEKAVILRDGKPSFLILDFSSYEDLMSEYLSLKDLLENTSDKISNNISLNESKKVKSNNFDEDDELKNALAKIDELDLAELTKDLNKTLDEHNIEEIKDIEIIEENKEIEAIETTEDNQESKEKQEPLKEFWE